MSAISRLCDCDESTTTAAIPMTAVGNPTVVSPTPPKKSRFAKLLARRGELPGKKVAEDGVIPQDAKVFAAENPGSATKAPAQNAPGAEPFIKTSVALVAPDTTPDAEKPLDPTQVPVSQTPATPVVQSSPTLPAEPSKTLSVDELFGFHNAAATESLKMNPTVSTAVIDPHAPPTEAAPATVEDGIAKAKASKIVSEAMSGTHVQPPPPTENASVLMQRSTAAYRSVIGD